MSKGTIFLSAVNNTDVVWKIEKSQMMVSLDCRSLSYFHISRNSLQRDAIQILGASDCEILPLADLRCISYTVR